jgi:hypothetical protein
MPKLLTVNVFLRGVVYEKHKDISRVPVIDDRRSLFLSA